MCGGGDKAGRDAGEAASWEWVGIDWAEGPAKSFAMDFLSYFGTGERVDVEELAE